MFGVCILTGLVCSTHRKNEKYMLDFSEKICSEKNHFYDLGTEGKIILKWTVRQGMIV
jgi:hypothetical protein